MVKLRFLRSGLLSAAMVAGLTTAGTAQTPTTLNISSSVGAQCVGGIYSLQACEAVRFTLNIPAIQNLTLAGQVLPGPGGSFTNFFIETFRLRATNTGGLWSFVTGPSSLLAASPAVFISGITTSIQNLSVATVTNVLAPVTFDVRFATYQSDLTGMDRMIAEAEGTNATEIGGYGRTANWSSATNVVTPEPVSMTLLGTGLFGLAAARRRKKQQQTEV